MNDRQLIKEYEKFRDLTHRYNYVKTKLNKVRIKLGLRQLRDCAPSIKEKKKENINKTTQNISEPVNKIVSKKDFETDKIIFYI